MNTLRVYDRDRSLPAAKGEFELCVPSDEEVLALVHRHLAVPGGPDIRAVALEYARWKPGVSITSAWEVRFASGEPETVTLKRFVTGKDRLVSENFKARERSAGETDRLHPFAAVADEATCLWTFPTDRVLRGAARVLDMHRTARLVDESGAFEPNAVRPRSTRAELIRYKPERRAVFRLDTKLRGPGGERVLRGPDGEGKLRRLGIRVLPPDLAAAVVENRRACAPNRDVILTPELVSCEPRTGILIETWLEGEVPAPAVFDHAALAGACLARLHANDAPFQARTVERSFVSLLPLFEVEPALLDALGRIQPPVPTMASTWTHGDFHPDQILLAPAGDGARLLDLDGLAPGDPVQDLASWIADRLVAAPDESFEDAAGELLEGYATTSRSIPDRGALAREASVELVHRAAAAIRRLELGGVEKARLLLERARVLAPIEPSQP